MKVLFVVTAFYPEQAIGSIRTSKFAKYLARSGVDVSVISLTPAPWAPRDESLHFSELDGIDWVQIDQSPLFKRLLQRFRSATVGNASAVGYVRPSGSGKALSATIKSSAQLAYTLLKSIDWVRQVKKHARRNMRGKRYDIIFSSYPSFSAPFAARALARMGLASHLIVDFRDPVSYGTNRSSGILPLLERKMLEGVGLASFVSKGVQQKVLAGSHVNVRSLVVTNGFDPDEAGAIGRSARMGTDPNVLRFAYVGALYGGRRDISPFFKAAKQALDNVGGRLELHYAGGEEELFLRQALKHDLEKYVVLHGRVSRAESLNLQNSADACVVVTWNSHEDSGILTGKVFEFFMLRKPVVAIVNGPLANSELGQIIERTQAGICYEEASPATFQQLVNWIENALRRKADDGNLAPTYNAHVNAFSYLSLTESIKSAWEALELEDGSEGL